jgi:hypothetical protein
VIKIRCPRCGELLPVPEKFAGKAISCPACLRAIRIPKIEGPDEPAAERPVDFDSLEAIEGAGESVAERKPPRRKRMTLAQAKAAGLEPDALAKEKARDPNTRMCPQCGTLIHAPDPYIEILCTECNEPIPGIPRTDVVDAKYAESLSQRIHHNVTFYTGFISASLYPLPALMYILLGLGVALAAIVVPAGIVVAFAAGSSLNPLAGKAELSWVPWFVTGMFAIEGFYFGAINYHILVDSIRGTASGTETPPPLTFSITAIGDALLGYLAIGVYYLVILVLLLLKAHGGLVIPESPADLYVLRTPGNLIILAVVTFMIPMNLIGLASGRMIDGLNPARVVRSILPVFGHYTFLFLIVTLYLFIYTGVMVAVMDWAGGAILHVVRNGIDEGLMPVASGLLAWAVVVAAGLFFSYVFGRLLGLFARTYKEHLDFDI